MIKESDLKWRTRYINNMKSNGVECFYSIIDYGNGEGRMFWIQPMMSADYKGMINVDAGYKYYCFFESSVKKKGLDAYAKFFNCRSYSGYSRVTDTLIQVYDSLEDAKKRAYVQYFHIYGYVVSSIGSDSEETTKNHFVV